MTSTSWDPEQYERFAAERARPFADLVARIPVGAGGPDHVVDLGCGPGTMTAILVERWPGASVLGIDSSPDMIEAAARRAVRGRLTFHRGDLVDWAPEPASVDVIVSNATLQWVPDHVALFPRWIAALRPDGVLAFGVPAPGGSAGPVFRAVATTPRWAERLAPVASAHGPQGASPVRPPAEYLDALITLGLAVDVWETTYQHVLTGADAVLEWFTGTGLRPYLDALGGDRTAVSAFRAEVAEQLRDVYPSRPYGTILPFRRIFAVATKRTPIG